MCDRFLFRLLVPTLALAVVGCQGQSSPAPAGGEAASAVAETPMAGGGTAPSASGRTSLLPQQPADSAPAVLARKLADRGEDGDGDGLFETLVIEVPVEVRTPGIFKVWLTLTDAEGNGLTTGDAQSVLEAGPYVFEVPLDGPSIRLHDVDGPYTVSSVELTMLDDTGVVLDWRREENALTTQAYASRDFLSPKLEIVGPVGDTAVDRDGDGADDAVSVRIRLDVREPGDYGLSAALDSDLYRRFSVAGIESVALEAGTTEVEITFDALDIRSYQVDGPYRVVSLVAKRFGASDADPVDRWDGDYETDAYAASQFAPMSSP